MKSQEVLYFREFGHGKPFILVHGLMIDGEMFEPVIERFAANRRVIVPDLRGHGNSRELPPLYTVSQLASDLQRLLDHLGIDQADVLGYSQGGAVAQQFALDYSACCGKLVLACTYAYNMATLREKMEGHLVPFLVSVLGMKRFAEVVISRGMKHLPAKRADWVIELIARQDGRKMIDAWKAAMAFDSRSRLKEIASTTLILAATNDDAVPMHHAQMLRDGIPLPKVVVIPDADHTLIWSHPDLFADAVERFLDEDHDG